jgi:hypothetical protein
LEFGDVQRSDVEATRFDAGAGPREGSGKNDGAAEGQGIGGVRLGGIDVDPLVDGERRGIKPCAIGEKSIAAKMRDGGFQMKTASDGNGDDFIIVGRKNGGELADAFRIAAPGEADKEVSADAKNVAAFESARKNNVFKLSKLGERFSKRRSFAAAGLRSEWKDYRQLIENDGRIFDEHRVGKIGLRGERNNTSTQFAEQLFVSVVLLLGGGQINGFAVDERNFAIDDSGTDGTCDGGEHFNRESLHENHAR